MATHEDTRHSSQSTDNRSFDDAYEIYKNLIYGKEAGVAALHPLVVNADGELVVNLSALPTGAATETTLASILSKINIYIDNEVPSGLVNGSNTSFTTFYNYKPGTTKVFLNGIRQKEGVGNDYFEAGTNVITYSSPPISGDVITIDYIK